MRVIGRLNEIKELNEYKNSNKSEFLVVYGRRRVGKTYLIREHFRNEIIFSHTGIADGNTSIQLAEFNKSLRYVRGDKHRLATDWFEAFDCLWEYIKESQTGRKIIFIDELPWMDTHKSYLLPALEHFWNDKISKRNDVFLIVCGSATSWVIGKLLKDKGGFYGRITGRLLIKPFTLKDCEEYYKDNGIVFSRYQMVESYMIFGGIPYYLSLMRKELGFSQNVDRICFFESANLRDEYELLYGSLFRNPQGYMTVVESLAAKKAGLNREEVLRKSGLSDGGGFTRILRDLEQCGFIRRYISYGKKKRDAIYQLIDPFTLFHLQFIKDNETHSSSFWSSYTDDGSHRAWTGYAFERVVLMHVEQIKRKLQIGGILTRQYSWYSSPKPGRKGAQIDLIIERNDGVMNLCEVKYARDEFEISADYEKQLRERTELFRRETGTRAALHTTLITTYGLKPNEYTASIQSSVTMEDLFT